MELINDFVVTRPIDETWDVLTDVERIAPALPGAELQEIEGDVYRGVVKVKVGPITAQFKGQATFVEKDDVNHKAVLNAAGRDTTGKGNASAVITAQLEPQGESSTKVTVTTDLTITGKVAQFGRGALADVSTKLLNQFVDNLENNILTQPKPAAASAMAAEPAAEAAATTAAAGATTTAATDEPPVVRRIDSPPAQPVDLLDTAGAPIAKRLAPVGLLALILLLLLRRRGKRKS